MNRIDEELIDAASLNNVPEVRRLWRAGADVHAKDHVGETPLHKACINGHAQVVKELLEHGADIEAKADEDWTPLHWACDRGHLPVIIELLSPNESNGTATTILGKRKSRGANIEAKDDVGDTPLHIAAIQGSVAIVRALLSGGANILAVNNDGELAIHQAVSRGRSEVSKCLLQHFYATSSRLPLHELLEDLTWIGNPNTNDAPPLRAALRWNVLRTDDVVEILEYLVGQNPALLSSRDRDRSLPLHVACRRGASFSIVQSLVNHYKASVKSRTPQGDLPLFLACEMPEPSSRHYLHLDEAVPRFGISTNPLDNR
jgi:ankyrin repeat protein